MNLEDRESESMSGIATQVQASKPAFEWSDDQQNLTLPVDSSEMWSQSEHLSAWVAFWCVTWAGTTFAGSLFGGVLGLVGIASSPAAPFFGLFYGGIWAGAVGLFVFVHLGAICWTFWWLGKPLTISIIAGALTGAIAGLLFFSLITAPLGAAGAYAAGNLFLQSSMGKKFLNTIKTIQNESLGTMRFTMLDLFLRVTVIAVFLAGWTAWIRSFPPR